jgi:hypothetical protein
VKRLRICVRCAIGLWFILLACICVSAQGNAASVQVTPSANDLKTCREIVQKYCQAWEKLNFKVMYNLRSKEGTLQTKDKFIATYQSYSDQGCKLTEFTMQDVFSRNNLVTAKVNLKIEKEILPILTSGVYTFSLIKEGKDWKIKYVTPPLLPPQPTSAPGGDHPGE